MTGRRDRFSSLIGTGRQCFPRRASAIRPGSGRWNPADISRAVPVRTLSSICFCCTFCFITVKPKSASRNGTRHAFWEEQMERTEWRTRALNMKKRGDREKNGTHTRLHAPAHVHARTHTRAHRRNIEQAAGQSPRVHDTKNLTIQVGIYVLNYKLNKIFSGRSPSRMPPFRVIQVENVHF